MAIEEWEDFDGTKDYDFVSKDFDDLYLRATNIGDGVEIEVYNDAEDEAYFIALDDETARAFAKHILHIQTTRK